MLYTEEWMAHWLFASGTGVSANLTLWGYHDSRISYQDCESNHDYNYSNSVWWEINATSHVWLSIICIMVYMSWVIITYYHPATCNIIMLLI